MQTSDIWSAANFSMIVADGLAPTGTKPSVTVMLIHLWLVLNKTILCMQYVYIVNQSAVMKLTIFKRFLEVSNPLDSLLLVSLSCYGINSLWPSGTIWQHRPGSTLAQGMACCLMASGHYLNQCWLHHQWGPMSFILGQFQKRYLSHRSQKFAWKLLT